MAIGFARPGPARGLAVPRGATVVDAAGKVLMPGLVDAHCHINQPAEDMKRYWLAQLRWGVTTMRSAGNDKPETVPLFRQTREPGRSSRRARTRPARASTSAVHILARRRSVPRRRPKRARTSRV